MEESNSFLYNFHHPGAVAEEKQLHPGGVFLSSAPDQLAKGAKIATLMTKLATNLSCVVAF